MSDVQTSTAGGPAVTENDNWFDDDNDDGGQETAAVNEQNQEPDKAAEPEKEQPKNRTVPHQALHAERIKRQQLENELRQERERVARFDERLATLNQLLEGNRAQTQAPPDPSQDPIAALQYTQAELAEMKRAREAEMREREALQRQQQEVYKQQEQISQLDSAYQASWLDKFSKAPETQDSYQYFISRLDRHFQIRGITDVRQRAAAVQSEERAIALAAIERGEDPADAIIELAKEMGFAMKPAQDAAAEIDRKQNGIKAARSMSSASGGAKAGAIISAADLADMSTEDFEELKGRLSPKEFRKIMGG